MADKAKEDKIDNFIRITDVDRDRARFYLESSGWNLELAMASFYEGDPEDDDMADHSVQGTERLGQPEASHSEQMGSGHITSKKKSAKKPANSRFATIGSMNADSDSSDEEGQAFYAGGSERSGQQVLGPKKKKTNIAEDLFKSAREHGAEEVRDSDTAKGRGPGAFIGSGYRLGDTEGTASEKISGLPVQERTRQVDSVLKLWKDGFSVDDGPLRDFKDPANQEFLASISKGEVPQELIRAARGGEVNLNMEDHRNENYVKPKVPVKAFTGEGHTLGSPAPRVVSTPAPTATTGSSRGGQSSLVVDDSIPSTTIQIRLADGSRLVQKFNLSHTVSDIRRHITLSRSQYEGANFVLQTTFPNRELTNESETIESAKLQNAVVVQRMK